ncbi:MAG: hypothetical protein QM768_12360 [Agriterribacter sp.]
MLEPFELPVQFGDQTILLPAELKIWGYSHRILVKLHEQVIIFEPDEERNYRALIEDTGKPPAPEMLKAITESIEAIFK